MTLSDADPDASGAPADQVFGTVRMDYSYTPPSTAFLTNVWGTVSPTLPYVVNSQG